MQLTEVAHALVRLSPDQARRLLNMLKRLETAAQPAQSSGSGS